MTSKPIGIFDSGVGGLSVLSEMKRILPHETFIYLADQAFIPYGKKTHEQLLERGEKIMNFFRKKDVKAVVVACNTATVYTIDEMRQKFGFPILGVVPVVKTIAELTKTGKTAVLSTPATAKSQYLKDLIKKYASGIEVEVIGGSNLEELVEEGDLDSWKIRLALEKVLRPLLSDNVDAIALGCTHYPFLKGQIQKIVGPNVSIVDSGGAVSRRLREVLTNNNALALQKGTDEYYTTGDTPKFKEVAEKLMEESMKEVLKVEI